MSPPPPPWAAPLTSSSRPSSPFARVTWTHCWLVGPHLRSVSGQLCLLYQLPYPLGHGSKPWPLPVSAGNLLHVLSLSLDLTDLSVCLVPVAFFLISMAEVLPPAMAISCTRDQIRSPVFSGTLFLHLFSVSFVSLSSLLNIKKHTQGAFSG